jgi:cytochrome b561
MIAETPTYGGVEKAVHWLTAALVVAMFAIAWTLIRFPDGAVIKEQLTVVHETLGLILLAITIGRVLSRLVRGFPALPGSVSRAERWLARTVETALYLCLLGLPVSGWVFANAFGNEVEFLGFLRMPRLAIKDIPVRDFAFYTHVYVGYLLLTLLALHVAGALRHHFVRRDEVLSRMLPRRRAPG